MIEKHHSIRMRPEHYFEYAQFDITGKCNANCANCCGHEARGIDDIPLEKLKEITKVVLKDCNVKTLWLTCVSEATLHKDFIPYLEYISSVSTRYTMVRQDTNGIFIPPKFIETTNNAKYIYDLSMSVWAYDKESYLKNNGTDNWKTIDNNIDIYMDNLKEGIRFSTAYISHEQNKKVLEYLDKKIKAHGRKMTTVEGITCDEVRRFKETKEVPVFVRAYYYYSKEKDDWVVSKHGEEVKFYEGNKCQYLNSAIVLKPDGSLTPCIGMHDVKEVDIGNIFNYSPFTYKDLINIYNGEQNKKYIYDNVTDLAFSKMCNHCVSRIAI